MRLVINFQVGRKISGLVAVKYFLGEPPVSAEDWTTASNLIVSQVVPPDNSISKVAPLAMAQNPALSLA
jgi:hypothetical protein